MIIDAWYMILYCMYHEWSHQVMVSIRSDFCQHRILRVSSAMWLYVYIYTYTHMIFWYMIFWYMIYDVWYIYTYICIYTYHIVYIYVSMYRYVWLFVVMYFKWFSNMLVMIDVEDDIPPGFERCIATSLV